MSDAGKSGKGGQKAASKRKRRQPPSDDTEVIDKQLREKAKIYKRGESHKTRKVKDKKLKGMMTREDKAAKAAALHAARAEILLSEEAGFLEAEGDLERTFKFSQHELKDNVDISTSAKMFDLKLDQLGPYSLRYSPNGRHMIIGGRKGHLATFDWVNTSLTSEIQVRETTRDVTFLHNELMYATAQKRFAYIYDHTGTELHVLRKHIDPTRLEFLRYHFLLASVGNAGYLKYQDTSTGQLVAEQRTRLGPCRTMTQNRYNGVIHLGHTNGTVTLWTPNLTNAAVKQLCHRGPVLGVAVDNGGTYMATSGLDGQLKIWDIRNFKDDPVHAYFTPTAASSLEFSQRGLLAVAHGCHVQVWKDVEKQKQNAPYMSHDLPGKDIYQCRFAPFEDVLGIGHSGGISSLVIPGAGEPNYDAYEANPYHTKKQRQEAEVKQLLDKIPADMITLDPTAILKIDRASSVVREKEQLEKMQANMKEKQEKFKKRGRSSSSRRYLKKQTNVIDEKKELLKQKLKKEKEERQQKHSKVPVTKSVLDRFAPSNN